MELSEILLVLAAVIVIIAVVTVYARKSASEKLTATVTKSFGKQPDKTYSAEKFSSIGYYHNKFKDKADFSIDDITWNDLSMDNIYMILNGAYSSMGEEYLYHLLRTPAVSKEELAKREELIQLFSNDRDFRIKTCRPLAEAGIINKISLYEYVDRLNDLKEESNAIHIEQFALFIASFVSIFFYPPIGVFATIIMFFINVCTYFKRKSEIEKYYTVVAYIMRSLETAKKICAVDNPVLQAQIPGLKETTSKLISITKGGSLVVSKKNAGDIIEVLMDYIRMATHIDLIRFNRMLSKLKKKQDEFTHIFETLGYIDSMCSIASFRKFFDFHCIPEFTDSNKEISFEDIYHPLIENPVLNSFSTEKSVLITGSNASGKSTFIKTVAINSILAQTINTAMAKSFRSSFFRCMSSMALKDNLFNGESYYIVEIKSLKRICNAINKDVPLLVFVDEVLRGTNTLERIAASSRILNYLGSANTITFAATHDIELTYILEKSYLQYHFEEKVTDNDVKFDYKIHEGRAVSRNAIKLLRVLGFNEDIVKDAENSVDSFIANNEWKVIE